MKTTIDRQNGAAVFQRRCDLRNAIHDAEACHRSLAMAGYATRACIQELPPVIDEMRAELRDLDFTR